MMENGLQDSNEASGLLGQLYQQVTAPLKVRKNSMYGIYSNMKKARADILDYMVMLHGSIPDVVLLSKPAYMLTYVCDRGRGAFTSGLFLQLPVTILWEYGLPDDRATFVDERDEVIGWYSGGNLCQITRLHIAEMNQHEAKLKVLELLDEGAKE